MGAEEIYENIEHVALEDAGANYIWIHQGVDIINSVFEKLSGLLVVILMMSIPIMVIIEVMYINFPVFQQKMLKIESSGEKAKKIIGFCFRDAQRAVTEANTVKTGRSVNVTYLIIKLKTILIILIIAELGIGGFNYIVSILLNIISKLITAICY